MSSKALSTEMEKLVLQKAKVSEVEEESQAQFHQTNFQWPPP